MKKVLLILIATILLLGLLASCGGPSGSGQSSGGAGGGGTSQGTPPAAPSAGGNSNGAGGKLTEGYISMLGGGKYYMKYRSVMEVQGETIEMTVEMAVEGEDVAMISNMNGMESTTITKGGKIYMVNHESKTVMVMSETPAAGDQSGQLPTDGYVYQESGTAELFGVPRAYEQYGTDTGATRFFYDGNKLVGIEAVMEEMTMQMEILEFSDNIPGGMFDVPADYTQMNIG